MKRVIDISDEGYDWIKNGFPDNEDKEFLIEAVKNSTPAVNLEKRSFIEGFKKGCEFGKKCYERSRGEWIIVDDTEKFIAKCSVCGRIEDSRMVKDYPFCHCGADMRGAESHLDNTPTVAINKDFYKTDKSNPINRSDLFQ